MMPLDSNICYRYSKSEWSEYIDNGAEFDDATVIVGIKRSSGVVIDKDDKLYDAVSNNFGGIFNDIEVKSVRSLMMLDVSSYGASEIVCIYLSKHGRENVINAINTLRYNPMIAYADPNGIIYLD